MITENFLSYKPYLDAICQASNLFILMSSEKPNATVIITLAKNIQQNLNHPKINALILNSPDDNSNYLHATLLVKFILNTFVKIS